MSDTDKVDVLARQVLNEVVHIDRQLSETAAIYEVDLVQSLVSASFHEGYCSGEAKGHAEGVAEGAEQMKEKIRMAGRNPLGSEGSWIIPYAVLAPTKENE